MPNISTYKKSRWLKKEDVTALSAEQRRTAVDRIEEEKVGDDLKPVCYFRGIDKGWPINMTGLDTLAELSGSDQTDDFIGVAVELYVDPSVSYQGKRCGGIKLRAPRRRPAPSEPVSTDEGVDELGF